MDDVREVSTIEEVKKLSKGLSHRGGRDKKKPLSQNGARSKIMMRMGPVIDRLYFLARYGKSQSIQVAAARALLDKGLPSLASVRVQDEGKRDLFINLMGGLKTEKVIEGTEGKPPEEIPETSAAMEKKYQEENESGEKP